jgi:hypothetical protein|tara:strand:+ start:1265 stop:1750 length:486 start_codon:yes stop_codon:yes gene_type:complete
LAGRIVFELFIFSIPFLVFGLYLLATTNAEQEGKRKWPVNILFLCGIGLATVAWFVLILMEPKERDICHEPARMENGKLIPARDYPCIHDVTNVGVPRERDSIRSATGATGPGEDVHDAGEIRATAPDTEDAARREEEPVILAPDPDADTPEIVRPDDDTD